MSAAEGVHAPADPERVAVVLELALGLATVQFLAGAGAEDAVATMSQVARTYGVRAADSDVTHTMLSMVWTDPATGASITRRRIVRGRGIDYDRMAKASVLFLDIVEGRLAVGPAAERLRELVGAPALYGVLVRRCGWGIIGAGAAVLLGGGWPVALAAFVASFGLDLLNAALGARRVPVVYQSLLGGVVGPLAAAVVALLDPGASSTLVVVATIIVLFAGVTIFGAVQDTISGFSLTGVARLTEAVVTTVGIAAGVLGTTLLLSSAGIDLLVLPSSGRSPFPAWVTVLAAVVIVIGFALAAQLPPRAVWAVCLLGAVAEAVFLLCEAAGFGGVWSSGAAAVVVGALGFPLARVSRTPSLAILVTSLVPLLPGRVMFEGLMRLAEHQVEGLLVVFTAAAVAGALATGAIIGQYLMQSLFSGGMRSRLRGRGPLLSVPGWLRRSGSRPQQ